LSSGGSPPFHRFADTPLKWRLIREAKASRNFTDLDEASPSWRQHAHAALDQAVWAAYGWDHRDPSAEDEDTILVRMLALNLERSAE